MFLDILTAILGGAIGSLVTIICFLPFIKYHRLMFSLNQEERFRRLQVEVPPEDPPPFIDQTKSPITDESLDLLGLEESGKLPPPDKLAATLLDDSNTTSEPIDCQCHPLTIHRPKQKDEDDNT